MVNIVACLSMDTDATTTSSARRGIAVVGTGAAGLAFAALLAKRGESVMLANRGPRGLSEIAEQRGVVLKLGDGPSELVPVESATGNIARTVRRSAVVIVAVGGDGGHALLGRVGEDVRGAALVMVVSSGFGSGAACEVALRDHGTRLPPVVEIVFPFVANEEQPGSVHIHGGKSWVPAGCDHHEQRDEILVSVQNLIPTVTELKSHMWMSMHCIPGILIPAMMICNAGRIGAGESFLFYRDGAFSEIDAIIAVLDRERAAIGEKIGLRVDSSLSWLNRVYGMRCGATSEVLECCEAYARRKAPVSFEHRFLTDHVPSSVVPLVMLGERHGVRAPMLRSIVTLASALTRRDLWADGELRASGIEAQWYGPSDSSERMSMLANDECCASLAESGWLP
jgi:opine dehydrogenase